MKVQVGIAKRCSKKLAAGVIAFSEEFGVGVWHQFLYTVLDGKVSPFAEQGFETKEAAVDDLCEILKIKPDALVEINEKDVDEYILRNTRNQWSPR
ncbi:MAG: hypothetical protein C5B50_27645 [Verrucomicrobia bacterium]|nr:MAG: hypothetical protein C5B50_27645 [Verrucomicrobiota bacterium]